MQHVFEIKFKTSPRKKRKRKASVRKAVTEVTTTNATITTATIVPSTWSTSEPWVTHARHSFVKTSALVKTVLYKLLKLTSLSATFTGNDLGLIFVHASTVPTPMQPCDFCSYVANQLCSSFGQNALKKGLCKTLNSFRKHGATLNTILQINTSVFGVPS